MQEPTIFPASESPTLQLAKSLIERPSITPNDAGCQDLIAHRLSAIGFEIYALPFADVQNLWAIRKSQNPQTAVPLLAFAGHTDVVPTGNVKDWDTPPFTPSIKDGYLYGRGAADMKGGLAAMITACERFIDSHPNHPGSIAFLITSDEEGPAINGTAKVMEYLKAQGIYLDYCVIGEPSSQKTVGDVLKNGRRGSFHGTLKILGMQGHVAYPHKADNPIHRALLPLAELVNTEWDSGNEYFPATSFQISNIHSGTGATNVIPGTLECHFNFRFNTESPPEILISKIKNIFENHPLKYELETTTSAYPFLTKMGKLVSACIESVEKITQKTPQLATDGGTSDGRFIAPTGTEVIEFGPCNHSIHAINECVRIEDLEMLTLMYEHVLQRILSD